MLKVLCLRCSVMNKIWFEEICKSFHSDFIYNLNSVPSFLESWLRQQKKVLVLSSARHYTKMLRVIYEVNTEQLFTYFFATNASIYPYSFIQYFSILHGENLIAEKKQKSRMQKQSSTLDRCNFFFY